MNQPERELAKRIVRHLDHGLDRLEPGTLARLAAARKSALSRYRERPEFAPGLAWAGQALARFGEYRFVDARVLVAVTALAAAVAGVAYWQSLSPANDLAEIEINLLTDELPVNAYLDKGFDSWLKRSPR